jgi:crotonobetainyl-CoA:carnitine CoA-transferase CaiB-like acyl-CoA transferase
VALNAYGWSGPWSSRRGFDSLVQMSSGIAEAGMRAAGSDKPVPLPVQALDHATGYLMAAAAVRGLTRRQTGGGSQYRLSLARTARLLADYPAASGQSPLAPETPADVHPHLEMTAWGRPGACVGRSAWGGARWHGTGRLRPCAASSPHGADFI